MKKQLDFIRPLNISAASFLHSHVADLLPMQGVNADELSRGRHKTKPSDFSSATHVQEYMGAGHTKIDDKVRPWTGQERRAVIPALMVQLQRGLFTAGRQQQGLRSRGSPTTRPSILPEEPSPSSMPSAAVLRSNKYKSAMSISLSSIDNYIPFSLYSLDPNSSTNILHAPCSSAHATKPTSLTQSPCELVSELHTAHKRAVSWGSPTDLTELEKPLQKPTDSRLQRASVYKCCPRRPYKLEKTKKLSAHEADKQHKCAFCRKPFMNKNDMKRHQISVHVRPVAWSCSALSGYEHVFHDSVNRPGQIDTCGYCGKEFRRSAQVSGGSALSGSITLQQITKQESEERMHHLKNVHKFRECNSSKKFYRADHFRQHLKHSHAARSGKWMNMLQNICMVHQSPHTVAASGVC